MNMTRRELAKGLGLLTLTAAAGGLADNRTAEGEQKMPQNSDVAFQPMPKSVAGIRIVDSKIAVEATELAREASPAFLFNHAARTYLFGALTGKAKGLRFDEELLYLASILHDLGLTEKFMGDLPFEIQGAQAASSFLEERGVTKARSAVVWDGIAMHASLIGSYRQPEIALVGEGAGADVISPDFSKIKKADAEEVVKAFPRLHFKDQFVKTCAEVVRRHPGGAGRSFMRDIGERYVPDFHPRNICDLIPKAPFEE